jgi:hypothetical protein
MIPNDELCFLKADLFDCEKPSLIYDNCIPDVMFCYKGLMIIGEAKTLDDYNKKHSYRQFESYMRECQSFPGESYIIICVPWPLFINAQNHFKLLKKKYNNKTSVIVISDNGLEETL